MRAVLVSAAAALVALLVLGLIDLLRIKADIESAKDQLTDLDFEVADNPGGIAGVAEGAAHRLERADRIADDSPWLSALGNLPIVDRQVDAVRHLTDQGIGLGETALAAAADLDDAIDAAAASPKGRVELVEVALETLDRLEKELEELDPGPGGWLVPPLAAARRELVGGAEKAIADLDERRNDLEGVLELLRGPSRYLILAANNAEMTAGSGMPLSAGIATIRNGDIEVGEFIPTSELWIGDNAVPVSGDLGALYAPMAFGYDFRGTTASPQFLTTAPILAEMAARTELGPVDGVLVVDAFALRDIVRATGPVEVDGTRYDADNIVDEILYRNYLRFDSLDERSERTRLQSRIATAVFEALQSREIRLGPLGVALTESADGRHLLAWSADEEVEKVWGSIGAIGIVYPFGLQVSVQNYDGNKLDYFLQPVASLDVVATEANGDVRARLSVSITNARRDDTSPYIEGPDPTNHFVFLGLHLPGAAHDIKALDFTPVAIGADPPNQAVTAIYGVPIGTTKTVSIDFTLPRTDAGLIGVVPGARVHPTLYYLRGELAGDDAKPLVLSLLPPVGGPTVPVPWTVTAALLALVSGALAILAGIQLRRLGSLAGFPRRALAVEPSR